MLIKQIGLLNTSRTNSPELILSAVEGSYINITNTVKGKTFRLSFAKLIQSVLRVAEALAEAQVEGSVIIILRYLVPEVGRRWKPKDADVLQATTLV